MKEFLSRVSCTAFIADGRGREGVAFDLVLEGIGKRVIGDLKLDQFAALVCRNSNEGGIWKRQSDLMGTIC